MGGGADPREGVKKEGEMHVSQICDKCTQFSYLAVGLRRLLIEVRPKNISRSPYPVVFALIACAPSRPTGAAASRISSRNSSRFS